MQKYIDTVLEERLSEYFKDVVYKLYEAPYNTVNSRSRGEWVFNGKPCFGEDIKRLYKLREEILGNFGDLPFSGEMEDRQSFIRWPMIASHENGNVAGGIWVESISKREAKIHIFADYNARKRNRGLCSEMFSYFKETYSNLVDKVCIDWGERDSFTDPTYFLEREGFRIKRGICCNRAYYEME